MGSYPSLASLCFFPLCSCMCHQKFEDEQLSFCEKQTANLLESISEIDDQEARNVGAG